MVASLVLAAGFVMPGHAAARQRRRGFGFNRYAPPTESPWIYDGKFVFCRVAFRNSPYGDGGGWFVDSPRADLNLPFRLGQLTTTSISRDETGEPNHVVLTLTNPHLFDCPFIMMTEPGGAEFDDAEAAALRTYLDKGGFLWADDFWGSYAFQWWASQIHKALPADQYPIVDVPLSDSLFHMQYNVMQIPQISSINFWEGSGHQTSERYQDSAVPHVRAIFDPSGRIMVLMTHNTDFGDAFEREGDSKEYFDTFAAKGYAFGVNVILYAMTH